MTAETIASLSTPPGTSGVAVIRVSGEQAGAVAVSLAGELPAPRRATLATLRDETGDPLDRALVLWFPAPHSFTGEDVLELQVHGGRAVVAAVLDAVFAVPGTRPAEAGEFTRRAFENGRLDLSEVEGLGDLLQAETQAQRRQAYGLFAGRLTSEADRLQALLLPILAQVEATIDFPDEGDVTSAAVIAARRDLVNLAEEVSGLLASADRGERIRDGVTVAIAGPPNAGKSTLLNALARRDVAIVSPQAGTTRDSLEVHLDLAGAAVDSRRHGGAARDLRSRGGGGDQADAGEDRRRGPDALAVTTEEGRGQRRQLRVRSAVWLVQTQIDLGGPIDAIRGSSCLRRDRGGHGRAGGGPDRLCRRADGRGTRGRRPPAPSADRGGPGGKAVAAALAVSHWDLQPELVAEQSALRALRRSGGRGDAWGPKPCWTSCSSAFCIGK
jgi:tRNA modification GTPase